MNFELIDIFFAVIVLISALICTAKGFIKEIFGKAAWIIGVLGGLALYPTVSPYLIVYIKNKILSDITAFIILFIVIYLILKLIQALVNAIFSGQVFHGLDRSLGFFLGILEGLFVCFVIILILRIQNFYDASDLLAGSLFYKIYLFILGSNGIRSGVVA